MELENNLADIVIGKAMKVHTALGPGLLESTYERCLYYELDKAGIYVKRQVEIPLIYDNLKVDVAYRADIIVEDKLILEIKSVDEIADIHIAQALTYIKLSNMRLALILNFNVTSLRKGIKRVAN